MANRPTEASIKRLFARSGNQCAFPKCAATLIEGDSVVGEICHIKASSPNGPRYDAGQGSEERHSDKNLILLCGFHHKIIDDDPEAYTVERLQKMKAAHEDRANGKLEQAQVERGAALLIDHSVATTNQTGGIAAQNVHLHIYSQEAVQKSEKSSAISKAQHIHDERVVAIASGFPKVKLLGGAKLVLHVIPFVSTGDQPRPPFEKISSNPTNFPPFRTDVPNDHRITYDGLLTGSNAKGLDEPQRAYVHVARSGAIEAVGSSLGVGKEGEYIELPYLQAILIKSICVYANALGKLGFEIPMLVYASLVDVMGKYLLQDFPEHRPLKAVPSGVLDRPNLSFGGAVLEILPKNFEEAASQIKPVLDHLANAAGLATSPYFDSEGTYLLASKLGRIG